MLTILTTLAGAAATLATLVLLLASGANSSPAQLRILRGLLLGVAIVGLGSVIGAIVTHRLGLPQVAPWIGGAPVPLTIALIVVLVKIEF